MVAALALLVASCLAPPQDATATPLVEKRYAVGRLVAEQEARDHWIEMAPTRHPQAQAIDAGRSRRSASPLDGDTLVSLVERCVSPAEWQADGRRLVVDGDELVVVASVAAQDEVAAFLAKLTQAIAPTGALEVRVLSPAPDDAASGLLPAADAEKALADAKTKGAKLVRELRLALRDGVVQRARGGESRAMVVDFEVVIAHAISAQRPITREARLGIELAARSARVDGATLLDVALREAEPAGEERRKIDARHLLLLDEESLDPPGAGTLSSVRSAFVSLAGTFLLPDGTALLLPCRVETADGPASFLLDLRVAGDARPPRARLDVAPSPEGGTARQLLVGSLGMRGLGGIEIAAPAPWLFDPFAVDDDYDDYGSAAFSPAREIDAELDWLRAAVELGHDDEDQHDGAPESLAGGAQWLVSRAHADRAFAAMAARTAVPPPLALTGEIVARGGRRLASFAAPLVEGRPLVLWSGRERMRLADWDVDVACNVNGMNPEMEPAVDGFALRLEAVRATTGGFELRVDGKLRFAIEPPSKRAIGGAEQLEIDEERARTLALGETRLVGAGGAALELGGDELTLKLAVTVPPATAASAPTAGTRLPIGGLRRVRASTGGRVALLPIAIGPVATPPAGSSDLGERELDRLFDDDDLVDFAKTAVAPETWNDAANGIEIDGDELVVRAPAEVTQRVADRVAFLARRRGPSRELVVRVRSADGATLLRTLRTTLRDRVPQRAASGARETFVRDWRTEICETSAAADPIVAELFRGLELAARCEAVDGGTLLALALSESEAAGETATIEPKATARLHTAAKLFTPLACGAIDRPRSAFLSLSGELFVPDGGTVRVPFRVDGVAGPCAYVLELELAGEKPPPPERPGQRLLAAVGALPTEPPDGLFDDGWPSDLSDEDETPHDCEFLVGRLAVDRRDNDPPDRLSDALAGALTIDATLVDAEGRVRAAFVVTPLGGRRLVLAGGVEGTRLARWDVDVANDASTSVPDLEAWVDGLVISLAPARDGAGRSLRVVAAACLLDELPRLRDLDDASKLEVEELRARRLHLDQIVALPDAGGTLTLGGGGLTLRLRCTPLATR